MRRGSRRVNKELVTRKTMRDCSLWGYLNRRSTKELDVILNYVVNSYVYKPEDTVRMIIKILMEREKDMEVEITPEVQAQWEEYLAKATIVQARQEAEGVYDYHP